MISAHVRIFVCTEPVDLRRSFDVLMLANTKKRRNLNPMSTRIERAIAPDGGLKGKLAALVAFGDP